MTLITLPLFHSTAQTAQMNAALYGGFRLVLLPRFDPAAVLEAFAREQVGLWIGVPTMYWALLDHARASGADVSGAAASLRLCASGGAPMPVELLRAFEAAFNVRILEGYGLSETAPVVAFNQLQRPSKPGTVGLPIFAVDVRCVDEHDNTLPPGERGEVVVRGPNVMKGYHGRPEATAEAMRGGWFRTGDIGQFDADGLPVDRRSQEGHDPARRFQRVPARDRGSPDDPSGSRHDGGHRRARSPIGGGSKGRYRAPARGRR